MKSDKKVLNAVLLCALGLVSLAGMHRFYVGKIGTGILCFLTLGGLGIWTLVDGVVLLMGKFTDAVGRTIENWINGCNPEVMLMETKTSLKLPGMRPKKKQD